MSKLYRVRYVTDDHDHYKYYTALDKDTAKCMFLEGADHKHTPIGRQENIVVTDVSKRRCGRNETACDGACGCDT